MNVKVIIGALLLVPVLAHLGYAVAYSPFANYYITVDEYAARAPARAARVGGQVVPGSIRWDNATRTLRFQLAGERITLDVTYRGIPPDSFRDGVTAIIEGARGAGGLFIASSLIVKCPHQYLPAG